MKLDKIKLEAIEESLRVEKINDNEYFSPKYAAYVSNSRLGNINPDQDGSPEKFFGKMGAIYSESLLTGSAVHAKVLQPELFELHELKNRPTAKLGFVCDWIWDHINDAPSVLKLIPKASEAVDYYKGKLTDTIIKNILEKFAAYQAERILIEETEGKEHLYLSSSLYEKSEACIKVCNENPYFQKLMHPDYLINEPVSENEQAFLLDIKCNFPDKESVILRLKAKLDNFTIDFENNTITVNDLKTIGSVVGKFGGENGNFVRFHYCRELAKLDGHS